MNGVALSIGFVVVFAGMVIIIHNSIIERFNRVNQAWSDLLATERQKVKILDRIEPMVKEHQNFEESLLTKVTELRSALGKLDSSLSQTDNSLAIDPSSLADVQRHSSSLLSGLRATFEAYPNLNTVEVYRQAMKAAEEQEEQVGAGIRIFNSNVQGFNTGIEVFPNNLVNKFFTRKKRVCEFTDTTISASFEYSPHV